LGGNANHLGDDPADLGRGVELPFALAALSGEVPHQILVGVAENVVVIRAVLRKIEFRFLENADEVGESIHHRLPLAELVRIVEIRKVGTGKA
jgi:hypothetical protein